MLRKRKSNVLKPKTEHNFLMDVTHNAKTKTKYAYNARTVHRNARGTYNLLGILGHGVRLSLGHEPLQHAHPETKGQPKTRYAS